jgi:hypothetical protein
MAQTIAKDFVKIPRQEYNLLKEIYRTVRRQALLMRISDTEKNYTAGKTKSITVDDLITTI